MKRTDEWEKFIGIVENFMYGDNGIFDAAVDSETLETYVLDIDQVIEMLKQYNKVLEIQGALTEQEQKILIENLIRCAILGGKQPRYIRTLVKNLEAKGMKRDEAYGAVINYAVGNGNYLDALINKGQFPQQGKEDIVTEVTEDTMIQMLLDKGVQTEANKRKLEDLGITVQGIDVRNVDSALKIIEGYDFKKAIGRNLTEQEQKVLIERLLSNSLLGEKKGYSISTLVKNLEAKGMRCDEAYGAVINYAIGNGSYARALQNDDKFKHKSKEDIVTEVTEDTLTKVAIKHQKAALKRARACVSKETVERKAETLDKLNALVVEVETQSVEQKE